MTRWYIDTSVLASYYFPEARSAAAQRFMDSVESPFISALTLLEMRSLTARKISRKELTGTLAEKALAVFQSHLREGYFHFLIPAAQHWELAGGLVERSTGALRSLDALHLAIARGEGAALVTADGGFASAARRMGLAVTLLGAR